MESDLGFCLLHAENDEVQAPAKAAPAQAMYGSLEAIASYFGHVSDERQHRDVALGCRVFGDVKLTEYC